MSEMCAALKVTRQGYYARESRPPSACAKRPSGEKRASKWKSANDLVKRRFEADGPNAAWFADIIYVKTRQGWLYLALVMDIWSRLIVESGYVHARTYATREEAALDLFEHIEVIYNRARTHLPLGCLSPAQFEEANWPKENSRSKAA